ncbi:homeobox-like domain superfamily protein [Agrobacterium phage Milano]|nr:homeobox-like domain superfamily protein [Agrobacterium phage Milano]
MKKKPRKVMSADERKEYILLNGAKLADQVGLNNVTAKLVSAVCDVNTSVMTIRHYFNNQRILQEAIAKSAYASKDVKAELRRA